jgi:uncharacterized membrane protein
MGVNNMMLILILLFVCLFCAIYLILSEMFHVPTMASTKTVLKLTQAKKSKGFHAAVLRLATDLSQHIHLPPYKRRTMAATLKYAGIELTPETYYANVIVKTALCLIPAVVCIFTVPLGIPLFVLLALKQYMNGVKQAEKIVAEKRSKIDSELPRFASTIATELQSSRDVLSILEGYHDSAGELFRDELEITIADMKSGSQEQALNRLAGRVGSAMLSQVVRGLLGVLQGGDGTMYFTLLAHDFQTLEEQKLEKKMLKRPEQLKKYIYLMLGCFISVYAYVLLVQIVTTAGNLF